MGFSKTGQRGVTLTGLLVVCVLLGLIGILAAKVLPAVIEYYNVVKNVKAVAQDSSLRGASLRDVKVAYDKRASIDDITSITPNDLDISKNGEQLVIEFSYSKKIPLFYNVSLVLDFEHSTDQATE